MTTPTIAAISTATTGSLNLEDFEDGFTITAPSGTSAGSLLVGFASTFNTGASGRISGFTIIHQSGSMPVFTLSYRVAEGPDEVYEVLGSASRRAQAAILRITHGEILDSGINSGEGSTAIANSLTSPGANHLLLSVWVVNGASGVLGDIPPEMTSRWNIWNSGGAASNRGQSKGASEIVGTGPTGTRSVSISEWQLWGAGSILLSPSGGRLVRTPGGYLRTASGILRPA